MYCMSIWGGKEIIIIEDKYIVNYEVGISVDYKTRSIVLVFY